MVTIQDNVNNYYFKTQADFEAEKDNIPVNSTIYIEETGEVNVTINGTETENIEDLNNIIVGDKTYKVTGGTSVSTNGLNVAQEVLWTNPNPTSKFVGQSINTSSPMTDFDYIMMTYYDVFDVRFLQSTIVPPGINFALEQVHGNQNMTFYASRYITYTDSTTLSIDYAYDQQSKTDANCVPVQLIGFKFLDTLNYSTEEQYTGKHWIDGKKIYQKTFVGSIPNANTIYTQDFDCSNVDTVIDTIKSDLFYVPTIISENHTRWYIDRTTNKFAIISQNTQFIGTFNMTIQYTKMTE